MSKDNEKAAKAIARRSVEKAGGKVHRRGVNMAPAVKKEANDKGSKSKW
jgi:hypothetical protein